jgi:nesprin-1
LAENVSSAMEEKDREFKRAKTIRSEYLKDVEEVQLWIQEAEKKVQDQTAEPQILKENLQVNWKNEKIKSRRTLVHI